MLSALLYLLGGIAIGLSFWSYVINVGLYYLPVYYLCAFVSIGMATLLRRAGL
jgi:hypothetical protein